MSKDALKQPLYWLGDHQVGEDYEKSEMPSCVNFMPETEMPGSKISSDELQIIRHRYYFASQFVRQKDVLEVGCGPGFGLGALRREAKRVVGGDITQESLRRAQQHYRERVDFVSLDAHNLPFRDHCFDVVICVASIIYLDVPAFLQECRRVLKKGGVFVLNTPNKDRPGFHPSDLSHKYYSVPELFALLNQYRFEPRFSGSFPAKSQGLRHKSQATVESAGARILNACAFVPGVTKFKGFLRKRLVSNEAFILPEEIEQEDMREVANIELIPLPAELPNPEYRIIYVVARAV